MITQKWQTSPRKYSIIEERGFKIPTSEGTLLDSYLFRPDSDKKFPLILGVSPYSLEDQVTPLMPVAPGVYAGIWKRGTINFLFRGGIST